MMCIQKSYTILILVRERRIALKHVLQVLLHARQVGRFAAHCLDDVTQRLGELNMQFLGQTNEVPHDELVVVQYGRHEERVRVEWQAEQAVVDEHEHGLYVPTVGIGKERRCARSAQQETHGVELCLHVHDALRQGVALDRDLEGPHGERLHGLRTLLQGMVESHHELVLQAREEALQLHVRHHLAFRIATAAENRHLDNGRLVAAALVGRHRLGVDAVFGVTACS